ncbi:MAG: hypothetical protein AB1540_14115 [Bdellovibrionota bacterium]
MDLKKLGIKLHLLFLLVAFPAASFAGWKAACDRLLSLKGSAQISQLAAPLVELATPAEFVRGKTAAEVRQETLERIAQKTRDEVRQELRLQVQAAERALDKNSIAISRSLQSSEVADFDVVFIGGFHGATFAGKFADRIRALYRKGRLARIPRVLIVSATKPASNFKDRPYLLNSFYTQVSSGSDGVLMGFDPNPSPASPFSPFEIGTGALPVSPRAFEGLLPRVLFDYAYFNKFSAMSEKDYKEAQAYVADINVDAKGAPLKGVSADQNQAKIIFVPASWVGDAALLAYHRSGIPLLSEQRVNEIGFNEKDPRNLSLQINSGPRIRSPLVVYSGGLGPEVIPFSDPQSQALFSTLQSEMKGGFPRAATFDGFMNAIKDPAVYEAFRNEEVLLLGDGDGGNILASHVMALDPRGTEYAFQCPGAIADSIKLTWSGQPAATAEEFLARQDAGRSEQSRGSFRKVLYRSLASLYGRANFTATRLHAQSISRTSEGRLRVVFSDGSSKVFDRIITAAGYENMVPRYTNELVSAGFKPSSIKLKMTQKESSLRGENLTAGYQFSLDDRPNSPRLIVTGAAAFREMGTDERFERIGPFNYRIRGPNGIVNIAYRVAELAENIANSFEVRRY